MSSDYELERALQFVRQTADLKRAVMDGLSQRPQDEPFAVTVADLRQLVRALDVTGLPTAYGLLERLRAALRRLS